MREHDDGDSDSDGGGGTLGLAALLLFVLVAGAALLLTMSPADPASGQQPVPAEAGCANGSSGALFGLVCAEDR
ncbi:hypothetical protein [Pseudonocardia sp. NPDC046786]|uniref:hypothetical protein n=1 Tax=Pseudonocardia sp. NPDC046786 TaxID=3155471 RepID=UPI0033C05D28